VKCKTCIPRHFGCSSGIPGSIGGVNSAIVLLPDYYISVFWWIEIEIVNLLTEEFAECEK